MCGRFVLAASEVEIKSHFQLSKGCIMKSRYNIAPAHMIPAIRSPNTQIDFFKWGFIPAWTKPHAESATLGYINARAETIFEKPAFKHAILRQRCIIPATGYYEWMQIKGKKQPYYISLQSNALFGFAGIWDTWQDSEGHQQDSCAIITVVASESIAFIHDRMPLILSTANHKIWLAPKVPQATLRDIMDTQGSLNNGFDYQFYAVSNRMNNPDFDTQQCLHSL